MTIEALPMLQRARDLIKKHEDRRLKPYKDTRGILTIGYGRNLEDNGISPAEAEFMLDNDLTAVMDDIRAAVPFFDALDDTRQIVLIDMRFNLGATGFRKFKKMLAAVEQARWDEAAAEILDSDAARQTGTRYVELAEMMRSG